MRLDQQIRSASALRLREIQEQLRSVSTFREIQTSISANALREIQTSISANALRDLRVNTSALQDLRVNTNALREIQTSISANALRDLRVNTNALRERQDRITTTAPFLEAIGNFRTIMDRVAAQNTVMVQSKLEF